jgi:PEP-CTERM motif
MVSKLAVLTMFVCVCVHSAHADSVITSSSASTTNNTSAATVDLTATSDQSTIWFNIPGGDWISVANTGNESGSNFVLEPNGFAVTFTDTFILTSLPSNATLDVLADDTASVTVNGVSVWSASSGPFPLCSTAVIGCLNSSEGTFNVLSDLTLGSNTLVFTTYQENGGPFGLDFALTEGAAQTPEPGTLIMLGSGLIGVLGLRGLRRRRGDAHFAE